MSSFWKKVLSVLKVVAIEGGKAVVEKKIEKGKK